MTGADESFDCLACAACCRGAGDGTVLVTPGDLVRFRAAGRGDLEASLVPGHFGLAGLPSAGGTCSHLGRVERGGGGTGAAEGEVAWPNHCAIYDVRPESCRLLEPGSPQCRTYRAEARARGERVTSASG